MDATLMAALPFAIELPAFRTYLFEIELWDGFTFSLRWYALAYIAGLLIGWWITVRLMKAPALWPGGTAPMKPEEPEALLTWMVLGVILGGRLGYVVFYDPGHFINNPAEIPMIWQGGMSFHGGFIGVILGVIFFCRARKLPLLQVADAVAIATPVGLFLGRCANFINGELWGRVTEQPWGMVFPTVARHGDLQRSIHDPEALYSAANQFAPFGVNLPRHASQLYEAVLEGLVLGLVLWFVAVKLGALKRPGTITGIFFIGYGLGRTIVEVFRQWDPQLTDFVAATGGLTMGQILSLPMIAIGMIFILVGQIVSRSRDGGAPAGEVPVETAGKTDGRG